MNWSNVKSLAIPVGGVSRDVKRVTIGGSVVWEKPSPLPYDAEVEYLESTGTQWIDTGVKGNENTRVELCISVSSLYSGAYSSIFGYYGTNIDSVSIFGGGTTRFGSRNTSFTTPSTNTIYQIAIDKAGFTVNGTTTSWSQSAQFETAGNLIAFGRNDTTFGLFSGKYYSLKIYQNGVLVRDYIPVRKGTVGYLYDRVSGALFGNAGTGAFGYGADLPYPIGG